MSTSGPTSLNRISSILLAIRQIYRPRPEKVLHHLKDREPWTSEKYRYLDALATLCSFASAQCEAASAAVKSEVHCNHLYMATSPSAPSTMRNQLLAWIDLIQELPVRDVESSPSPDYDSESEYESDVESDSESVVGSDVSSTSGPNAFEEPYTIPEQAFIAKIYRVCHAKLLNIVTRDDAGQNLLDYMIGMVERHIEVSDEIAVSSLAADLQSLLGLGKKCTSESLSDGDLLELHRAAGVLAPFKDMFLTPFALLLQDVDRLSQAVDTLLAFATSRKHKERINLPWTVVCIDVPRAARDFLATEDRDELADMVDQNLSDVLREYETKWIPFEPYGDVRVVEGPSGRGRHVTGNGVVHCESAFVRHIVSNRMSLDPYIGCSHPICYACLMLVRACNRAFRADVGVGPREIRLRKLDVAWSYPDMGPAVYRRLQNYLVGDLKQLCMNSGHDRRVLPLGF